MLKVLFASTSLFASLVLAAIGMGVVVLFAPVTMEALFNAAGGIKSWIVSRGIPSKYNVFMQFLIEERQLVYMGFVIVARALLGMIGATGRRVFGRPPPGRY